MPRSTSTARSAGRSPRSAIRIVPASRRSTATPQSTKGDSFARLSAADQDAVLGDVERNAATGFSQSSAFFNLVLAHTIQGTFCDPHYGGNANFVGWDLDWLSRCPPGRDQ